MDTNTRWGLMKLNPEVAPNCPRCASSNTKFCYYNNYSLSQPRYFCKGCRRYWTKGGSLRNVPVGGGCRKSRRGRSSRPLTSSPETIPSYMSRSGGGDPLMPQDANSSNNLNGQDIDMAAVFAKFLDAHSETESGDRETDHTKDDDLFFELTSSLGSNTNEEESFFLDCNNSDTRLFGQEVMQEFIAAGDETFEGSYDASFGLDDLLSDQVIPCPEAMWRSYHDGLDSDAFCPSMVSQEECVPCSLSDDFNQMKDSGNGLVDHKWGVESCFDVTSYEVFSRP